MSAPSVMDTERIDFAALTDQLRILPTTVSWVGVQDSIRMLRQRPVGDRQRPDMQDHLRNVEVFADTIRDHTELIAYSLACAVTLAYVSTGSSSGPAAYAALQTISRAYNFSALSPTEVMGYMQRVWAVLRRYARDERPQPPISVERPAAEANADAALEPLDTTMPPIVATRVDVDPYFEWLGRVLAVARTAPVAPTVLGRAQRDAWDNILVRCEDATRGRPDGITSVAEVICAQAKLAPSSVLGLSLREAPATAWASFVVPDSRLVAPSETVLPWWAHGLAAHALGFRTSDEATMRAMFSLLAGMPLPTGVRRATDDETEPRDDAFSARLYHLLVPRPVTQALFVIRREADSLVNAWLPSPTSAVLPLTSTQVGTLLDVIEVLKTKVGLFLGPSARGIEYVVAVEQGAASSETNTLLDRLVKGLIPSGSDTRVRRIGFGIADRDASGPSLDAFVLKPERYEDLLVPSGIQRASYNPRAR